MEQIRRGDIILFYYKYDPIAWLIRTFTKSKWNHIGVALHGTVILDLRATKKRTAHIKRFKSHIYKLKVLRIKNATREVKEAIIANINAQPKIRIWRRMLWKFFLMFFGIPSNICKNCTEVIAQPMREHGYDICPDKDVRLFSPEDFNTSPLLETIIERVNVKEILSWKI